MKNRSAIWKFEFMIDSVGLMSHIQMTYLFYGMMDEICMWVVVQDLPGEIFE